LKRERKEKKEGKMRETNEEIRSEQSATAKMTEIAHTLALDQVDHTV
jgi:hypothetical protein